MNEIGNNSRLNVICITIMVVMIILNVIFMYTYINIKLIDAMHTCEETNVDIRTKAVVVALQDEMITYNFGNRNCTLSLSSTYTPVNATVYIFTSRSGRCSIIARTVDCKIGIIFYNIFYTLIGIAITACVWIGIYTSCIGFLNFCVKQYKACYPSLLQTVPEQSIN